MERITPKKGRAQGAAAPCAHPFFGSFLVWLISY